MSLPYYSSLNSQMAEYLKQVKMQEYNDTYQQAQLDIVLEGQRNLASQAEIMNRLKELQTQIANQATQTIIPLSKTNAPEVAKQIEEQKFPTLTAAEYENKARTARKVPTMEELNYPEIVIDKYTPNNAIYDLKEIVIGDPNLSTQFKNELKKKLNNILKNPPKKEVRLKLPDEIINQIKNKNYSLKTKKKISTKLKNELEADFRDRELTRFAKKSIISKPKRKILKPMIEEIDYSNPIFTEEKMPPIVIEEKIPASSSNIPSFAGFPYGATKDFLPRSKPGAKKMLPGYTLKEKKQGISQLPKGSGIKRNAKGQFTKK